MYSSIQRLHKLTKSKSQKKVAKDNKKAILLIKILVSNVGENRKKDNWEQAAVA